MAEMESSRVTSIRTGSKPRMLPSRSSFTQFMNGLVVLGQRTDIEHGKQLLAEDFPGHTVYLAFRYMDLISADGKVTHHLTRLLNYDIGSEQWMSVLHEITTHCYAFVFTNLGNRLNEIHPRKLSEVFEHVAPTKGNVDQMVDFFRRLCWAAGIPIRLLQQEQNRQEASKRSGKYYPAVLEEFIEKTAAQDPEPVTRSPELADVEEELPGSDQAAAHLLLQKAVADVLDVIGDPESLELCYATLRAALPAQAPGEPPPIPPFDPSWDAECRSKWFDLRKVWMQHQLAQKADKV